MHSIIRVLLADDHPFVRAGVRAMLMNDLALCVVGEASDSNEALQLCLELAPDVLLLDLSMPGPSPLETVALLHLHCPTVRVLVLTAFDDDAYIRALRNAGVAGYLLKDEMPTTVVQAIYGAMRGEPWFMQPRETRLARTRAGEFAPTLIHALTPRERSVLRLVVTGQTNTEIADTLGISEKTVEKHLDSLFGKLEVSTRVEAAVWAVRSGLA